VSVVELNAAAADLLAFHPLWLYLTPASALNVAKPQVAELSTRKITRGDLV
jgi:hypothetical protein